MDTFNGTKQIGKFKIPSGGEYFGELIFSVENTSLKLFADSDVDISDDYCQVIQGVINGQQRVTLIDCFAGEIVRRNNPSSWTGTALYSVEIFPHYIALGTAHFEPEKDLISKVSFVISDAAVLFFDVGVFGTKICTEADIEPIVNPPTKQSSDRSQIGPSPIIAYYTGKREIFQTTTCIGEISASHHPSLESSGPHGAAIKNTITITIKFCADTFFKDAYQRVLILQRFLGLIIGRPQKNLSLQIYIKDKETGTQSSPLEVYSSMMGQVRSDDIGMRPHPGDILINGAQDAEIFCSTLASWLAKNEDWHFARSRFFGCFEEQNTFDKDRLIAAANMFDILPDSALPAPTTVTDELKNAKCEAKKLFKQLPDSDERTSLLDALGRIGKSSLKKKIEFRANILINATGAKYREIFTVAKMAVSYRNFYVHGTKPRRIDLVKGEELEWFFTTTLEFIFAASDLIDSGWDINSWLLSNPSQSHPFSRYSLNYESNLNQFKCACKQTST